MYKYPFDVGKNTHIILFATFILDITFNVIEHSITLNYNLYHTLINFNKFNNFKNKIFFCDLYIIYEQDNSISRIIR